MDKEAPAEKTPAEQREALIAHKMRVCNMTRENAELVIKSQEESDARRAKTARKN